MIQTEKRKSGRRWINIDSEREVIYWSGKFNCTPERLISVVKRAGNSPVRVARELEKKEATS